MPARPSIVLDFIARNASLLRAARQNEQALRRQRRFAAAAGRSAARAAAGYAALTAALALAAARSAQLVRNSLDSAQALDTFSAATGVSVQDLQRLETAGAGVGLVFDDVADVLQTFTESVGLARRGLLAGTGGAQFDALRFLGFSPEEILAAERDISGTFDRFFQRLRDRSRAEQQEIIGEFSLPDSARRLLALPDSPLRVLVDVEEVSRQDNQRLLQLEQRYQTERLRFTRALSRFVARNADSIDGFIDAFERNTPAILQAGATLASAISSVGGLVLRTFQELERRFGSGRDPETGEARFTTDDIITGGTIAAISLFFRERLISWIGAFFRAIGREIRFVAQFAASRGQAGRLATQIARSVAGIIPLFLLAIGSGAAAAAATLTSLPFSVVAGIAFIITGALDEIVTGGGARRYLSSVIQSLFDWIGEQIREIRDGPAIEVVLPPATNRFDQPSQTASFARQPPVPPAAQEASAAGVLEAILTERLQQIEDEVSRLRQDQDVELAQGTQAQAIRTLERLRELLTLRAATRQQQRELQQLGDPEFVAEAHAQSLIALRRQVAELDQQIAAAADPEAQRLRQQLQQRQRDLADLEAEPFSVAQFQADRLTAIEQEVREAEALAALRDDPAFRAAQRRLSQIEIVAEGESLLQQLEQFPQLAQQRRQNEALRLRIATAQAQDATQALQSQRALRAQEAQARQALTNAQLREELGQFDATAPGRQQERALRSRLGLLQRAEQAQDRINGLSVEYYDTAISALGDLLTGVNSLADSVRRLVQEILSTTVRSYLDATLGQSVLRSLAGAGQGVGQGNVLDTTAGGPNLGAAGKAVVDALIAAPGAVGGTVTVTANIDARGGDEQSIRRGLNQALPDFERVVNESRIARLTLSPVDRDRERRALGM